MNRKTCVNLSDEKENENFTLVFYVLMDLEFEFWSDMLFDYDMLHKRNGGVNTPLFTLMLRWLNVHASKSLRFHHMPRSSGTWREAPSSFFIFSFLRLIWNDFHHHFACFRFIETQQLCLKLKPRKRFDLQLYAEKGRDCY